MFQGLRCSYFRQRVSGEMSEPAYRSMTVRFFLVFTRSMLATSWRASSKLVKCLFCFPVRLYRSFSRRIPPLSPKILSGAFLGFTGLDRVTDCGLVPAAYFVWLVVKVLAYNVRFRNIAPHSWHSLDGSSALVDVDALLRDAEMRPFRRYIYADIGRA